MRHIKQSDLRAVIDDAWLQSARTALEALESSVPAFERSDFIEKNAPLWRALKDRMANLSHDKCWYSEVRIARTELEVDHFRPKNRVSKAGLRHRGYWWLSFEWTNFRLAYSLIHKRRTDTREQDVQGKGCYFPLVDEGARVPDAVRASTAGEFPVLLDPCRASDVRLLDYLVEDGKVVERFKHAQDKIKHERAKKSIHFFHLNEGTLIVERHEIYVAISDLCDKVERLEDARDLNGELALDQDAEYDRILDRLGEMTNASAKFSSFARACLKQRGDRGWNIELLART